MWDLHGPGLEPVSPALAGGFFFFLNKFTLFYFILFLFVAALGLRCCTWAFLWLWQAGATLCHGAQASH